jgi:ribose transport system substrate-binding protein
MPITSAIPYINQTDQAMAKIAKRYGYNWIEFPNQGSPAQWVQGMEQAIAKKVDLIILQGAPVPQLLGPQLAAAKAAGIPVLLTHIIDVSGECPSSVTACVKAPFNQSGRLEADWVIQQSKGKANTLVITSNEVLPSNGIVASIQDEFTKRCGPTCKVTVVNVPVADWATKIGSETQNALNANPDMKYVIPIYDSMSFFAVPAITAAGKSKSVKIATYNGTPGVMKFLADGNVVAMEVGENLDWLASAFMDQAMRMLTGTKLITNGIANTPLRVFDASNIAQAGSPPAQSKGYGKSYYTGYAKLWSGRN